jgi:hypothetical protein
VVWNKQLRARCSPEPFSFVNTECLRGTCWPLNAEITNQRFTAFFEPIDLIRSLSAQATTVMAKYLIQVSLGHVFADFRIDPKSGKARICSFRSLFGFLDGCACDAAQNIPFCVTMKK